MRYTGIVLWWKDSLGYGFVSVEGIPDVLVHFTALPEGVKSLATGDCISFELINGPRGLKAVDVRMERKTVCEPPPEEKDQHEDI